MASPARLTFARQITKGIPRLEKIHCGGFKSKCTTSVLQFFGVDKNSFKFCQHVPDMLRLFKKNDWIPVSVPQTGGAVKNLNKFLGRGYYLVVVPKHVLLIYISEQKELSYSVDTHPFSGQNDLRRVEELYKIENKKK